MVMMRKIRAREMHAKAGPDANITTADQQAGDTAGQHEHTIHDRAQNPMEKHTNTACETSS